MTTNHDEIPVGSLDVLPRIAATRWPHRAALRAGARTLTFADLDRAVSRVAFGLRAVLGGDGLPVAVSALPGVDFPVAYYAVVRSGNVVVPVNPRMPTATSPGCSTRPRCAPWCSVGRCTNASGRCCPRWSRCCCSTRRPGRACGRAPS